MSRKIAQLELYERQAEICAALANPTRLMILDLLAEEEATATDLQQVLKIPKSNLSQHLKVLKNAGILKVRNQGTFQNLSLGIPEVKEACVLVRKVLATQMSQQVELAKSLKSKFS